MTESSFTLHYSSDVRNKQGLNVALPQESFHLYIGKGLWVFGAFSSIHTWDSARVECGSYFL